MKWCRFGPILQIHGSQDRGYSPFCSRSVAVGMAPSSNPRGRGFRRSGEGNTGLTLHWDSTTFLNWVYTSGSLTTPQLKVYNSEPLSQRERKKKKALFLPDILSNLDMCWNGRSSLWYSVDPQQVWTLTFISAQTSFTLFSTFSSSDVTWKGENQERKATVSTQRDTTVTLSNNSKSSLSTSSWKATALTEPSCSMRLATTSSGLPRLTMRLLSDRCENRHVGKSHTMPGNLHPG